MRNLNLKNKQLGFLEFLSAAAPIIGAGLSFLGGKARNEEAAASSARQMEFQERMSNTAHQREVVDLRAAGLNPILSSKYGGASTPTGSQYNPENVAAGASEAFKSAAQNYWSAKSIKSNIDLQTEQGYATASQSDKNTADAQLANAKRLELEGTTPLAEQNIRIARETVTKVEAEVKAILQTTSNAKEQQKLIIQNKEKLIMEIKMLKVKLPRAQYDALLDSNPIIKAVIAIDRGLPIAQTILGGVGLGKLGKMFGGKKKIPMQKNPFGGGYTRRTYPFK